ncbi:putative metalloprotease CJM1_0395 family protein [Colwellia echini]|uniref:SprA-related family protein n=1 Tax=Colwellia echini TaxID=1982103 RepID=A0ABY3MZF0_9GAMM|nr:putative metalloprotease CJM1_0395 family protein [Colwellia echini]TYK66580.1 hypothetical protein CWS31_004385 [Colwellia echini]
MNITSHAASIPLATVVNQPTEVLRRDNHQREITPQVAATHPSAADKGVASEKERSRTPAQTNENIDFENLRKQAEQAASSVSAKGSSQDESPQGGQQSNQQATQQDIEDPDSDHNHNSSKNSTAEHDESGHKESTENNQEAVANEKIINQLQLRDKEVKAHELAHASTGGATTGSPSYTFEVGPDGKKYAVAGEVSVDLSSVPGDPKATITKMQKVYAAALAPADPSVQDIRVAASATQKILSAQSELLALNNGNADEASRANKGSEYTKASLKIDNTNNEFDVFINKTLAAQEAITSNAANNSLTPAVSNNLQSNEVIQRAHRIESFYFNISQGYEKPDSFQFELTA